jgi:hypothetical protein
MSANARRRNCVCCARSQLPSTLLRAEQARGLNPKLSLRHECDLQPSLIADALQARGFWAEHIMSKTARRLHTLRRLPK